jgi:hypothetical protein
MTMLQAVKRLVGADRKSEAPVPPAPPTLDREALEKPITAARTQLDAARAEHEAAQARVHAADEKLAEAKAAFDSDGSEELADRVLGLQRERERAALFAQRTQRQVVVADGAVSEAEAARRSAMVAHAKARMDLVPERLHALWQVKGVPAARAMVAFIEEADALLNDAHAAVVEMKQFGALDQPQFVKSQGIEALRLLMTSWVAEVVPPNLRIRLERLFGG